MGESPLMQIAGDQAALITVLVRAIGARRALEVGTFLGYGAISIARGLPEDGELICCELDEDYAERAREPPRGGGARRPGRDPGRARRSRRCAAIDRGRRRSTSPSSTPTRTSYPDYYEEACACCGPAG